MGEESKNQVKRGPGRPRKQPLIEREELREPIKSNQLKMRAQPNWTTVDPDAVDTPDRLRIPDGLIPDGLTAQWVTASVMGQPVPHHRSDFERKGWTPVHQDDFDGQFDGVFMQKGASGEINVDGLVLMVRPTEMTNKAERANKQRAYEQVAIKEQALRGGDIPISLDARHPSATGTNRISKTMERIEVPKD